MAKRMDLMLAAVLAAAFVPHAGAYSTPISQRIGSCRRLRHAPLMWEKILPEEDKVQPMQTMASGIAPKKSRKSQAVVPTKVTAEPETPVAVEDTAAIAALEAATKEMEAAWANAEAAITAEVEAEAGIAKAEKAVEEAQEELARAKAAAAEAKEETARMHAVVESLAEEVAVADGMVPMGLGSDTRGSVRIPAALCGVTGFKPTQRRVPRDGCFPLSYTLDSVGALAHSAACCAVYDAILSGESAAGAAPPAALPASSARLLVPRGSVLFAGLDATVSAAFERSLSVLRAAGAMVVECDAPVIDAVHGLYAGGGFAGPESWQIHRERMAKHADRLDPSVAKRILMGKVRCRPLWPATCPLVADGLY